MSQYTELFNALVITVPGETVEAFRKIVKSPERLKALIQEDKPRAMALLWGLAKSGDAERVALAAQALSTDQIISELSGESRFNGEKMITSGDGLLEMIDLFDEDQKTGILARRGAGAILIRSPAEAKKFIGMICPFSSADKAKILSDFMVIYYLLEHLPYADVVEQIESLDETDALTVLKQPGMVAGLVKKSAAEGGNGQQIVAMIERIDPPAGRFNILQDYENIEQLALAGHGDTAIRWIGACPKKNALKILSTENSKSNSVESFLRRRGFDTQIDALRHAWYPGTDIDFSKPEPN